MKNLPLPDVLYHFVVSYFSIAHQAIPLHGNILMVVKNFPANFTFSLMFQSVWIIWNIMFEARFFSPDVLNWWVIILMTGNIISSEATITYLCYPISNLLESLRQELKCSFFICIVISNTIFEAQRRISAISKTMM